MNSETEQLDQRWLPNAALYSKMKIVAIDDEPANVALLEAMLEEGGYSRVKTVTDSRLAMETCISFEPDLVLLDLMMPDLGGVRVLEEIRDDPELAETPVVVVTGKIDAVPGMKQLLGDDHVFLKPFAVAELLATVAKITGGP